MKCLSVIFVLALAACTGGQPDPVRLTCADLQAGCDLPIDGQRLYVRFSTPPSPLKQFGLEVSAEAQKVEASFQMKGMEMGFNRYRLQAEAGKWHARVILPACIQGRSDWLLLLDIKTAGTSRRYELPFSAAPFSSGAPN